MASTRLFWMMCIIIMGLHPSFSQKDKDYLKMIRREPIRKMKEWIICDTCKLAMKSINRRARAMRDAYAHTELSEEHYSNITRYLCQPYHDHGEWITTYDIVRKKKGLSLQHKEGAG